MNYWNHNVAHHPLVLRAVPDRCAEALDVGCGDGRFERKLAARVTRVTGIDTSPEMLALARERGKGLANAAFREGDFLAADLKAGSYDFVCSVSAVHHMDFAAALTRMRELLRPGGVLVVVGLARDATAGDRVFGALGVPGWLVNRLRRNHGGPAGMPVLDPEMSWREVRDEARRLLPGVRYRRHLLWRYSLVWRNAPS
ncbi:class I SAM-dependent methyltransferase [Streptomyces sp. 6N223]|uniref:class I SAM-dependent methyltransferase n=1 Tax=Streptomyces sp. 6N223 TaxID=3457412 RepID=UPI003FD630FC